MIILMGDHPFVESWRGGVEEGGSDGGDLKA
jgi:hypothetical protein